MIQPIEGNGGQVHTISPEQTKKVPKILAIDDDPVILQFIQHFLEKLGYQVQTARSGEGILEAVERFHPDLILLDVYIPGASGFDICRLLRSHSTTNTVPIIFLTATTEESALVLGFELGANDFVTKPFRLPIFQARIKATLQIKERQDALQAQNEQLQQFVRTDQLTGLYNRWYLEEKFQQELSRAIRFCEPLSCAMLDVDNFKGVNDTYGHLQGDEVLRQLASFLKRSTRLVDTVGRWGGEEFLLLFPHTDDQQAILAGEKIRAGVNALEVPINGNLLSMSVSIGLAVFPTHAQTCTEIIKAADAALYRAKASGRNRVMPAGPLEAGR